MKPQTGKSATHNAKKFRAHLRQFIKHLRKGVADVAEPKARALFKTSADVLTGLAKALPDYEKRREKAGRSGRGAIVNKRTGGGRKRGSGRKKS